MLIVGGGIGGLTTALALQRRGIACEVHERAPELREIGAGLSLWPAPLRVFDDLGLGAPVRALGRPWAIAGIRRADGTPLVQYTAEQLAARLGEATIGVHRGELQALLLDSLSPGTVRTGRECVAVDDAAPGPVRATFADGSEAFGRALIAADGRRSSIRRILFGQGELHDCRAVAWRGTAVEPPGVDWHSFAGESWGRTIRFGVLPISGNRVAWFASARAFEHDGGKDELRTRLAHFHEPIPALLEATDEASIWRDHIDDHWPLRRWSAGRVALLGDAAHPMAPDFGQGACHAVLDAGVIAEALTRHEPADAFRAYERSRRRRAGTVTLVARAASAAGAARSQWAWAVQETLVAKTPPSALLRQLEFIAAG